MTVTKLTNQQTHSFKGHTIVIYQPRGCGGFWYYNIYQYGILKYAANNSEGERNENDASFSAETRINQNKFV